MARNKGCLSIPPSPKPYPWLMFTHGKSSTIQTFYSILENRSYMRKIPDLSNKSIRACSEGWILLVENDGQSDDSFLLNLASMEKIKLPPKGNSDWRHCILSAPPTEPNCIVALFDSDRPCAVVWSPGQESWTQHDYGSRRRDLVTNVTVCDKKIYGFINFDHFAMIDIMDSKLTVRLLGTKRPPRLPWGVVYFHQYFVESCGEMFLVRLSMLGELGTRIQVIDVYKWDSRNLEWMKVDNIGDRVFFLNGPTRSLSCSATESDLRPNSIYFTNGKDTSLYMYDIGEDTIHVSLPCPNVVYRIRDIDWVIIQT